MLLRQRDWGFCDKGMLLGQKDQGKKCFVCRHSRWIQEFTWPGRTGDGQSCTHQELLRAITNGCPLISCDLTSPDATTLVSLCQCTTWCCCQRRAFPFSHHHIPCAILSQHLLANIPIGEAISIGRIQSDHASAHDARHAALSLVLARSPNGRSVLFV